jgi:peptide/nickel transport system ATP-binding protein
MSLAVPPSSGDPFVGLADPPDLLHELDGEEASERPRSGFWRRVRHQPFAIAGAAFLLIVIVAAIFAPLIAPYPPNLQNLDLVNAGPSAAHWFGTDDLGRDILSRLIWGARISLRATFEIVGIAILFAVPIGLVAGFFRGMADAVIMRIMDAMFSFPPLILALTVAALLGGGLNQTAIAIAIVFIPSFVRLLRGEVIAVREENYVEAARSLGATSNRLIRRHIVPNVASPIIIQVSLSLGFALLTEAGLSYLGLGEQPPTPSWGSMLNEGYQFIFNTPWALIFPGLAIMLSVLSFNLVADGLRDSLGRERPKSSSLAAPDNEGRLSALARLRGIAPRSARGTLPPVAAASKSEPLLAVKDLRIEFLTNGEWTPVVEEVNFTLERGKTLGLVGESGSGKTVSALAIMGLLPPRGCRPGGAARFEGRNLMSVSPADFRQLRGNEIAMIFQEPMTSLNPAYTVGNQIAEQVRTHRNLSKADSWKVATEMLDRVEIPNAANRARDYPFAFSGGMRQRVMIAMALSCSPKLLIADEPTTALDVTTQAQIVELLHTLQREEDMAMIFVTHDLGVIADVADDVVVMYAGQIVEQTPSAALFTQPRHPYTEALLNSIPQLTPPGEPLHFIPGIVPRPDQIPPGCRFNPRCDYAVEACTISPVELRPAGGSADDTNGSSPTPEELAGRRSQLIPLSRCLRQDELTLAGARPAATVPPAAAAVAVPDQDPLLVVSALTKEFPLRSGLLQRVSGSVLAVDAVDLTIYPGKTLGLVGESGSGKSTLARLVTRLIEPTSGHVVLGGTDITELRGPKLRGERQGMQMVFQDPYSSLDPQQNILEIVGEPLMIHTSMNRAERQERVIELLTQVGIGRHVLGRQPHEFSGGQRQRLAIARALALEPGLLVCDEPVSALDVSTQSQVINLLSDLQDRLGLAYLFIAHDLSVVRHLSDRIAVMYLGKIVEEGEADEVYARPTHPYTAALLSAIPVPDPLHQRHIPRIVLRGEVDTGQAAAGGCRFRDRCPFAMDICASVDPEPYLTPSGTTVRCHLHTEGPALAGASVTDLQPATTGAPA